MKQLWDVRVYTVKAGKAGRFDMQAQAQGQQEAEALVIRHYMAQGHHVEAVSSELVAQED